MSRTPTTSDATVRRTRLRLSATHSDGGSAHEIPSSGVFGAARECSAAEHVAARDHAYCLLSFQCPSVTARRVLPIVFMYVHDNPYMKTFIISLVPSI